jgi:putative addiction module antidote
VRRGQFAAEVTRDAKYSTKQKIPQISPFKADQSSIRLCQRALVRPCQQRRFAVTTIKVRKVGNSLGVVLTKELVARLRVTQGDQLFVQETVDGVQLTPYDPEFGRQMEIAKRVMREDRDALRALSK